MSVVRVPRGLAVLADGSRPVRLAALFLAGLGAAFLLESAAHAVFPTTTERGVVVASSVDRLSGESADYTIAAVLDGGRAVDLTDRNAEGLVATLRGGMPVLVTRSGADGQVLAVRTPEGLVDTAGFGGAWVLRVAAVVAVIGGLGVGLRAVRRDRWWAAVALLVPAVAFSASLWTGPELQGAHALPDGMGVFADGLPDRVVALGAPARVEEVTVIVRGAPRPGLPAGADPDLAGFETVSVPLTTRAETARHLRMELVGDGAGRAELLDGHPVPACGGAPGALGDEVPAGTTDLVLCAVVPTGFEPRYLVLGTAGPEQTAVALR